MSGFLLDTNCISELVRNKPEPRVLEWIEAADESLLYLSVLTLGEIWKGVAGLSQGKRRTQLETWLELDMQARFSGRILSIDPPIADRVGFAGGGSQAPRVVPIGSRRFARGDRSSPQPYDCDAQCERLRPYASAGLEPL